MTLSTPWLTHLFLISIRLGMVLLLCPIQALRQAPIRIRLVILFVFSMILVGNTPAPVAMNDAHLLISALCECANGLILATSLYAAFAVFQIAGQLIDNQIGLNALAVFKPDEHAQESLASHLLSMLATLYFLSINGHLWLFKGLCYSFFIIPPGTFKLLPGFAPVIQQFGLMFSLSLIIASPIIVALLTIELSGAVMTRTMPQVNSYFFTLPIKILLGLALFALLIGYMNPLAQRAFEGCFLAWQEMFA